MTFKSMDIKCILITCGGGGIGLAIADHLKGCPYYVLNTGTVEVIPEFVKTITIEHPGLDELANNAGVQRPLSVEKVSVEEFRENADNEININIRGSMHLARGLLPHLKQKPGAVIVNVSSVLGYVPTSVINLVYNGTKAWLHFWSMSLRTQLEQAGTKVCVVEIVPPTVGTDLHHERENPDDNKKKANAGFLSVEVAMEEVAAQLEEYEDVIICRPRQEHRSSVVQGVWVRLREGFVGKQE